MQRLQFHARSLLQGFQSHERVFSLAVAVAIGVLAGFAAIAFQYMIFALRGVFGMSQESAREGVQGAFWMLPEYTAELAGLAGLGIVLSPVIGGLIVGPLIHRFAPEARGHGVPEVMAAVLTKGGYIRPRVVAVKSLASALTIGSGGSVGREGPIVQIGSTIGSTLGYLLRLPPRLMRIFVACGAAGGIAATFNAPIAGSLFAVEIILGDFGFVQLAPIVTSAVTATVISRGLVGNFAAFEVPSYELVNPFELLPYIGLGLACGGVAVLFIRLLDRMENLFDQRLRLHDALKPALGGLVIGLIGLFFHQIFGVGYEAVDAALHGNVPVLLLCALVFAKLIATTVTLASGGSGGIFAPSLFLGAMVGGLVGKAASAFLPGLTASSGAYSLVGMAAMVGATTHAPITAIMIIFELTNDYKIILPLMISTVISVLTASTLWRQSIYTHKLQRKGIEIDYGLEGNLLKKVRVRDMMRKEFEQVPQDLPFNFLVDQLLQTARSHLPVVDEQGRMKGVVFRRLAQKFLQEKMALTDVVLASDVVAKAYPFLLPGDTLDQAMLRFNESGMRELYVLKDMVNRQLAGVVHKGDLMDAYQREMIKRSSGDTFAYNINHPHRMESVKVMDGYGILEIESPHNFAGKVLQELDLRKRFGINVLAVKRRSTDGDVSTTRVWVPESTDRLEDGDVLVLLGKTENINNLRTLW